jgi:DNA-directed RNA polymerase specialized sigma24 family protein
LEAAEFEEIISNYIDALNIIKKMGSPTKRAIILYKVEGYNNWEIALLLGISERTVERLIKSIKIFCRKVGR